MQRSSPTQLAELLRTARELPIEHRFAWLRQACEGDQALYQRAMASFQLEISHAEWWMGPPAEPGSDSTLGMVIGRYRVIGKIGSGGLSDVLLAVPADDGAGDGNAARVAIKIIRRANASAQLHSRLKVERQILGALEHPNIARLLDGGSTSDGMPYLVMEFLRGNPIDQHCNGRRLSIHERLRLFQSICHAVHAAHRLSIVHRDLKPSNVMVTADGVPKLLDFGIAKILDDRQIEQTQVVTHADMRMLTPDYASPEQIRGDAVTPASDIYSLGVLLYELLCGCNPRRTAIQPAAMDKQLSPVTTMHGEPIRSLKERIDERTATDGKRWLEDLCRLRSTQPELLKHDLNEDLNRIVLTALEREPAKRHASAEAFAMSIDRLLNHAAPVARDSGNESSARVRRPAMSIVVAILTVLLLAAFMLWRGVF